MRLPPGAKVRPVAATPGASLPDWLKRVGGVLAINGGYFNHSDGVAVSHVGTDGHWLTHPERNRALLRNPHLRGRLDAVLTRRVAWFDTGTTWLIRAWADAPTRWVHALQAGPQLLPELGLAEEAFRFRGPTGWRDGIQSQQPAARSALGLRPDGGMIWAVASAPGLTVRQMADVMRHLQCQAAMALDGGGSSTLAWREGAVVRRLVGVGGAPRPLPSALVWDDPRWQVQLVAGCAP
ncbi:MAG: phosphodiester glycosidase family protein [Candidatus Sericytochromatia bacterium]|nr:phosphodiester glycosidase family protein [Candidatus Sericytochromatia bacterium]